MAMNFGQGSLSLILALLAAQVAVSSALASSFSLRTVLTFEKYNACQQWQAVGSQGQLACASMSKCYGRRLVLDMDGCSSVADDNLQSLHEWFDSVLDGIVNVEYDSMVAAGDIYTQNSIVYADSGSLPSSYYDDVLQAAGYDPATVDALNAAAAATNNAGTVPYGPDSSTYTNPQNLTQWNLDSISAQTQYWDSGKYGKGHVVAVLDSGMAATAAPAIQMLLNGFDFISDPDIALDGDGRDSNAFDPGDKKTGECEASSWHGTYVTTILAARHQENVFKGIAPEAPILPVRVLGKCKTGYASDVADAVAWAVGANITGMGSNSMYPAKSIVMSFTGRGQCPSYLQSVITMARDVYNVTLFAAAGNEGLDVSEYFPANCDGVISVGAADYLGQPTSYSSKNADLYLPGGTFDYPVPCLGADLRVGGCVGTSMAVPHAGGVWALDNTNNAWVDPATLPGPLSPEYVAWVSSLPHATYELAKPDSAAYIAAAAAGDPCLSPSLLYADGFCGIRMNTSSDLRTIFTTGYPVVELQPGVYSDATRHNNLVASNPNNIPGFTSTFIYSVTPDAVTWQGPGGGAKQFTVSAGFNLSISNIKIDTPGMLCSGAGATLQINNMTIQGSCLGGTVLTVNSGCAIVTTGYFQATGLVNIPAYILYMDGIDVNRSSIGGDLFKVEIINTNAAIFLRLPSLPTTEWVWTVKTIESNLGNYGIGQAGGAGGGIVMNNARVAIPSINVKFSSSAVPSMQFLLTNSQVRMTDKINRWTTATCYYCQYHVFAQLDVTSSLTFDSSMTEFNLYYGRHPINVRGGKVYVKANNVNIMGTVGATFGLYDGAYMEWTGSNATFSRNTGVFASIFRIMGNSVLNFSGSNHTFIDNSGLGYYVNDNNGAAASAGTMNASAGIFSLQNGTLLFQASSVTFNQTNNIQAIYATQNSKVFISGSNINFLNGIGFGQSVYGQTVGSIILLNNSLLSMQDTASISFQNNSLTPLLMWYRMDGNSNSMLLDYLNRTSMALANSNASFNASDANPSASAGSGSMQFTSAGQYVSLPVDNINLMSAMLRGGITISLWFRMSPSSGTNARVFDFCTGDWGTAPGYRLSFGRSATTNSLYFLATNPAGAAGQYTYSTTNTVDSSWHHMVWQIGTSSVWSIWIDNVLACNACTNGGIGPISYSNNGPGLSLAPYTGPTNVFRFTRGTFGRSCTVSGDGWFLGAIDDFRVYSRQLTTAEIATLYTKIPSGMANNIFLADPQASSNGTAIAVLGQSSLALNSQATKVTCSNNFVASYGGCIFLDRFANVSMGDVAIASSSSSTNNIQFTNNVAVLGGGAVQVDLTYVGLNMSNLVGVNNTVLEGDGGFISITGGGSYVYASSTWVNIQCQGNAALQGRGGCLFILYNDTYTNIPHDISIVNPSFGANNFAALNNSNILYIDEPWVNISGGAVFPKASDVYLRGLASSSRCPSYPCTLTGFYHTGDTNPSFQGRCPAGTAIDPYGASNVCVKVYNTWDNIRNQTDFRTASNFLLLPGFYTNTAWYFCNFVFTVVGSYNSVNFTAVGHFSASGQLVDNRDTAMFDCQDTGNGLTINSGFSVRLTGIGFARSIRSVYCLGCTVVMENIVVRNGNPSQPAIETSTTSALITRGTLSVNYPRPSSIIALKLWSLDTSKSEFGGSLWTLESVSASAYVNVMHVSCASTSIPLKWTVRNLTMTGFSGSAGANLYATGLALSNCLTSVQHVHVSSSVLQTAFTVGTSSMLNVTGSLTLNGVTAAYVFSTTAATSVINLLQIPMSVTGGSLIQTMFTLSANSRLSASVSNLQFVNQTIQFGLATSLVYMQSSGISATWNCSGCLISNVTSPNSGGLFIIPAGSSLNFIGSDSVYSNIVSAGTGGIFSVTGTSARLSISGSNVTFSGSMAKGATGGGVIYANTNAAVTIAGRDIIFSGNNASFGGAIAMNASSLTVTASNVLFQNNYANFTADAVVWYRFDDSAASMLLDSSVNRYHLATTASNSSFFDSTNFTQGTGSMMFTAAYRQWANIPLAFNPSTLYYSSWGGVSFSFWYWMSTTSGSSAKIFDLADGLTTYIANPSNYMFVGRSSTSANLVFNIMNTQYTTTTGTAVNNAWHYVVWVVSGNGVWTIYLDNNVVCSSCQTRQIPAGVAWTRQTFGRGSFTTDGQLVGGIDDFRVFQRPVYAAEVSILWSGRNGAAPGMGGAVSLTGGSVLSINASNTTFSKNYALQLGGAIYADRTSSWQLAATTTSPSDAVEFLNNTAELGGGGIYDIISSSPLNMSNVIAMNNRVVNGSGGFIALVNPVPRSTSFVTNWWRNLQCSGNLALAGRGGCIFVSNNESATGFVPFEINLINPIIAPGTNKASATALPALSNRRRNLLQDASSSSTTTSVISSGGIMYGGSWTYLEGSIIVGSASELSITGFSSYCPDGISCIVSDVYSGDPNPQYNRSTTTPRCLAGSFLDTSTSTCQSCPDGTFSSAPGMTYCRTCSTCRTDYEVVRKCTNTTNVVCSICPPGMYREPLQGTCIACSPGQYSTTFAADSCDLCPSNTFASASGSTSCSPCPVGTYTAQPAGNDVCIACPAGTYQFSMDYGNGTAAQPVCVPCPSGTYSNATAATSNATCIPCKAGTYSDLAGANSSALCQPCSPGTYSNTTGAASSSVCINCPAGTYSNASGATSSAVCAKCPAGTYSFSTGTNSRGMCIPCGAGRFSTVEGATNESVCQLCQQGTYSSVAVAASNASCTKCLAGTYSTAVGASSNATCLPCWDGTFSAAQGSTSCTSCPAGTYSIGSGNTACAACGNGTYTSRVGLTACVPCPVGSSTTVSKSGVKTT